MQAQIVKRYYYIKTQLKNNSSLDLHYSKKKALMTIIGKPFYKRKNVAIYTI